MPLQNRVLPTGEIVAAPWRGRLMGNRGCLHQHDGTLGRARWRSKAWISCVLAFRGRWRAPMPPGRYTALFFADEAAALAAGHRPCGECRLAAHVAFKAAWAAAGLPGRRAAEIDAHLHAARVGPDSAPLRHKAQPGDLPDGAFVLSPEADGAPCLLMDGALHPLEDGAYLAARPTPAVPVTVLTPLPILATLAAGYRPEIALAPGGGSVQPARPPRG